MEKNDIILNTNGDIASEDTYKAVRGYVVDAQKQVTVAVNSAMVIAYWNIGKQIYEACGENERAEYGKQLLKYLSDKLTREFGKGFDESNLRNMRRFYNIFPIRDALRPELYSKVLCAHRFKNWGLDSSRFRANADVCKLLHS